MRVNSHSVPEIKPPTKNEKEEMILKIFPNPSGNKITIIATILKTDEKFPVNIKFYKLTGEKVKEFIIINGVNSNIDISDVASGSYLVIATTDFSSITNGNINLKKSKLIIVEK